MKDFIAGAAGVTLVAFSLFGGVDGGMLIAAGLVGLLMCLTVAA